MKFYRASAMVILVAFAIQMICFFSWFQPHFYIIMWPWQLSWFFFTSAAIGILAFSQMILAEVEGV